MLEIFVYGVLLFTEILALELLINYSLWDLSVSLIIPRAKFVVYLHRSRLMLLLSVMAYKIPGLGLIARVSNFYILLVFLLVLIVL